MTVQHVDVRQFSQAIENEFRGLELFALDDIREGRVVLEQGVVELRDQLATGPVPELEDGRHQPDPRHVGGQPVLCEQFKGCWMGGGGPRIGLRLGIIVEQAHAQAAPPEQPGAEQSDRSAARNENRVAVAFHAWLLTRCIETRNVDQSSFLA